MPHPSRDDDVGSWHHVMNRGIARRPVFESRADIRYFLSRIARVVRHGELDLLAFAILPTHFHLLVGSRGNALSRALGRVENAYVRWFNRRRRRDGPLFRGRFTSFRITSERYFEQVLAYLDANPVDARLAPAAAEYPWCSAWYRARPSRPRWLRDDRVPSGVRFSGGAPPPRWLVERRLARRNESEEDPLDDLIGAAPDRVAAWMQRKARLADGTRPGLAVAAPSDVVAAVEQELAATATSGLQGATAEVRRLLACGLVRSLCGETWSRVALHARCSVSTAKDSADAHSRRLQSDSSYAALASQAAIRALAGAAANGLHATDPDPRA